MKHTTTVIIILLIGSLLVSCGDKKAPDNSDQKTQDQTQVKSQSTLANLPVLPQEKRQELYEKIDYVDYIFYNLDFSMSQSDMSAVKANIGYIGNDPAPHGSSNCPKAMGRKFFHANGEILMEADIILSPSCNYYVFMDGNTPIYANQMNQIGIDFYNNLIRQVAGGVQQ